MYSSYPTLSKQSKTVKQRGVGIHSPVKYRRSGDHRHVGRGGGAASALYPVGKKMIVSVLHLFGVSNCVFFRLSLIKCGHLVLYYGQVMFGSPSYGQVAEAEKGCN